MTTQLAEHIQVLEARIQCLIDKLLAHYAKQYEDGGIAFDVVKGVKYYKLIQRDVKRSTLNGNTGASVHAFIHRQTGCVYKPASWKALLSTYVITSWTRYRLPPASKMQIGLAHTCT